MIKVWIDTDVGGDIDDALALLLAMSSKQLEIVGVSTVYENTLARARIAKTLLALGGKGDVPVYVGESTPLRATYVHTIPLDINRLPKTYEEDVFGNAVAISAVFSRNFFYSLFIPFIKKTYYFFVIHKASPFFAIRRLHYIRQNLYPFSDISKKILS